MSVDANAIVNEALDTYRNYALQMHNLTDADEVFEIIFRDRINALNERLESFVNAQCAGKAEVSGKNLAFALIAYFDDIERIKRFHQITRVNEIKIHAYTAFWILRKKPLQVLQEFEESEAINELFVTTYLMDFILKDKTGIVLTDAEKKQFDELPKNIYYTFKYRHYDAQSIELMLISFLAGYSLGVSG